MKGKGGGTSITMIECYNQYVKDMGKDKTKLGKWSWIRIEGSNNIETTVITAQSPRKPRQQSYYSTFAQQQRYFIMNGINDYPNINFRRGLLDFIELRKSKGEKSAYIGWQQKYAIW